MTRVLRHCTRPLFSALRLLVPMSSRGMAMWTLATIRNPAFHHSQGALFRSELVSVEPEGTLAIRLLTKANRIQ